MNNHLFGGLGNDQLAAVDGDNRLFGNEGDDSLFSGAGADLLSGGDGIDTADYASSDAAVQVSLQNDSATGGYAEDDQLEDIEHLSGSLHSDALQGDQQSNALEGRDGDDLLQGMAGDDNILGGDGDDVLEGGFGHDLLMGDSGNDVLQGGQGDDVMIGGAGDNLIIGGQGNDSVLYFQNLNSVQINVDGNDVLVTHAEGQTDRIRSTEYLLFEDVEIDVNALIDYMNEGQSIDEAVDFASQKGQAPSQAQIQAAAAAWGVLMAGASVQATESEDRILTSDQTNSDDFDKTVESSVLSSVAVATESGYTSPIKAAFENDKSAIDSSGYVIKDPQSTVKATDEVKQEQVPIKSAPQSLDAPVKAAPAFIEDAPELEAVAFNGARAAIIIAEIENELVLNEDEAVELNIGLQGDGGAVGQVQIRISGLPEGASLSAGQNLGQGEWILNVGDLNGLQLYPAANSDENFSLQLTVTNISAEGSTQSLPQTIDVTVNAVADGSVLHVQSTSTMEDQVIDLQIDSVLIDDDGSESQIIMIEGLPAGATLSSGAVQDDGSWQLQAGDLNGLQLIPPTHQADDFRFDGDGNIN